MMRAVGDVEIELARVMHAPPVMESKAVAGWIARLQSLCAEVRRAEKRRLRSAVTKSKGETHGAR